MSEGQSTTTKEAIKELIDHLNNTASSNENGRAKALTITKLEEALMWYEKIFNA